MARPSECMSRQRVFGPGIIKDWILRIVCPTVPFCETMLVVSPVRRVEDDAGDIADAGIADLAAGRVEPRDRQGRPARAANAHDGSTRGSRLARDERWPRKTRTASSAASGRRRAVPQPVDHQDETQAVAIDRRPVVATDLLARRGNADHAQLEPDRTTKLGSSGLLIEREPRGPSLFPGLSRSRTRPQGG